MPTDLDRDEKLELRGLGWNITRRKAKRPRRIRASNVLRIGEYRDLELVEGQLVVYGLEGKA